MGYKHHFLRIYNMIILTHIGQQLPNYLSDFITQIKKFNNDYEIVFLVNEVNCNHEIFKTNNIKTYPIESLVTNRINTFISNFGYGNFQTITKNIIYGSSDYWCVAAIRLFFVYEYALKENIISFFHFENDIMVYEDLNYIEKLIIENNLYRNKISMTRGTNNKIMTGFMYVNNLEILGHILFEINNYLETKLDLFSFGIDHLNEMGLLHIYQIKNPEKLVNLPIFPNNNLTEDFEIFKSVFDPATYGQYLDGTPGSPGQSILPDSIIRNEFNNNTNVSVTFFEVNQCRIPFVVLNGERFKINSLHIHSKRLHLFLS